MGTLAGHRPCGGDTQPSQCLDRSHVPPRSRGSAWRGPAVDQWVVAPGGPPHGQGARLGSVACAHPAPHVRPSSPLRLDLKTGTCGMTAMGATARSWLARAQDILPARVLLLLAGVALEAQQGGRRVTGLAGQATRMGGRRGPKRCRRRRVLGAWSQLKTRQWPGLCRLLRRCVRWCHVVLMHVVWCAAQETSVLLAQPAAGRPGEAAQGHQPRGARVVQWRPGV